MKNLMMTPVIGVKKIKASDAMTKKAYCEYRGWDVPKDEDPDELVVLVEYEPEAGKARNHLNHEGYISMSPLDVFEKAYKMPHINIVLPSFELAPFQARVVKEAEDLNTKIAALEFFTKGAVFSRLGKNQQDVMLSQLSAMVYYFTCLSERICEFKEVLMDHHHIFPETLSLGGFVKAFNDGHCLARTIWKDTDKKFAFKQVPAVIGSEIVPNMQSLPDSAKKLFGDSFEDESEQIDSIFYANQLVIVGLSNTIDSYSPSVQDIFAEDWYIVD